MTYPSVQRYMERNIKSRCTEQILNIVDMTIYYTAAHGTDDKLSINSSQSGLMFESVCFIIRKQIILYSCIHKRNLVKSVLKSLQA